jgi:phage shock protein PspC (stress-responsive transcriptional regulator)
MIQSIKITLNKTTFTLNDGAYKLLNNYVQDLKENFKNEPETLFDLEARIAELLTIYLTASGQDLVTEIHVNETIKTIGTVNELLEGTGRENGSSFKSNNRTNEVRTKLYRNPTNQSLGGVCSGIGYYFNIDSSIVRFLFVVASFFFGSSALIYLLLWIFVPKATNTEDVKALVDFEINNPNKLYRNQPTKVIAGVCSGLAIHLGLEIWIVRLLFVVGLLVFGFSILGYLLAWLIIPINGNNYQTPNNNANTEYMYRNQEQVGVIRSVFNIVIAAIAVFLLGTLIVSLFFTAGLFSFFTSIDLFDFLSETILFDENLSLLISGVLLIVFTPILFLLAIIAKYAFKANIKFRYAGFGLVFLFFLGIGFLVYSGINISPKYFQTIDSTDTENNDLPQNDSLKIIVNEVITGRSIDLFSKNELKIQLCDSGMFVPIDYEIDNTLEDKSTYTINKQYKGIRVSNNKARQSQMVLDYKLSGDSIIFPSHYFIPKPYKFSFQDIKVNFYLKENIRFYANETAQKVFGFIGKRETPTQFWFEINSINSYKNGDSDQSKFEKKQEELENKIEEKQAEIERKLEEKEAELERKSDNL